MAKDKERSVNPAQAQRKADKAKALKKARSEHQARRNEKLARRNPNSIQRQIDELKALEAAGDIKAREKAILADLERDLKAILKARELQSGTSATPTTSDTRSDRKRVENNSVLGKRRHDGTPGGHHNDHQSSGSDTDESVRNIPMPRDTPPPLPREYRRPRRPDHQAGQSGSQSQPHQGRIYESKTTYSSAPQMRDLKKEATSRFVPDAVRRKQDAARGQGGLLEPEEMDKLEREGYFGAGNTTMPQGAGQQIFTNDHQRQSGADTNRGLEEKTRTLQDEEERFERELAEDMEVDPNDSDTGQERITMPDNTTTPPRQVEHQIDRDEDEDEDEDEDDYLPPMMSGKVLSQSKPANTDAVIPIAATVRTNASSIAAGLFGKLPPPRISNSKQVEMEEVEDEDL